MRKTGFVFALLLLMAAGAAEASTQAWVWADNPAAAAYAPVAVRAFNPSGGAITINRLGLGSYNVRFVGLAPLANTGGALLAGNVQVTPYIGAGVCSAQNWAVAGVDVVITVQCRNPAGGAADLRYTVLYTFN